MTSLSAFDAASSFSPVPHFSDSPAVLPVEDAVRLVHRNLGSLHNSSIISAHVEIGSKKNPQSLVHKATMGAINEQLNRVLEEVFGEHEVPHEDSPAETAGRIVAGSVGAFHVYQRQNPDENLETQLDNFISILSEAVDKGFGEARKILAGMGVLDGDVARNIDRTYEHVLEGYEKFKASMLEIHNPKSTKTS